MSRDLLRLELALYALEINVGHLPSRRTGLLRVAFVSPWDRNSSKPSKKRQPSRLLPGKILRMLLVPLLCEVQALCWCYRIPREKKGEFDAFLNFAWELLKWRVEMADERTSQRVRHTVFALYSPKIHAANCHYIENGPLFPALASCD